MIRDHIKALGLTQKQACDLLKRKTKRPVSLRSLQYWIAGTPPQWAVAILAREVEKASK